MTTRLITLKEALHRSSLSKAEIYRRINLGTFPKPVRLGPQRIAFVEAEIDAWVRGISGTRPSVSSNLFEKGEL